MHGATVKTVKMRLVDSYRHIPIDKTSQFIYIWFKELLEL